MRLSETARDVKHRWWAVVINRMIFYRMTYYFSQGRVETPIRIGGQLCYSSVANLLQYLCAKNYQNTMQLDKVIAKNKRVQFFCPHSVHKSIIQWIKNLESAYRYVHRKTYKYCWANFAALMPNFRNKMCNCAYGYCCAVDAVASLNTLSANHRCHTCYW